MVNQFLFNFVSCFSILFFFSSSSAVSSSSCSSSVNRVPLLSQNFDAPSPVRTSYTASANTTFSGDSPATQIWTLDQTQTAQGTNDKFNGLYCLRSEWIASPTSYAGGFYTAFDTMSVPPSSSSSSSSSSLSSWSSSFELNVSSSLFVADPSTCQANVLYSTDQGVTWLSLASFSPGTSSALIPYSFILPLTSSSSAPLALVPLYFRFRFSVTSPATGARCRLDFDDFTFQQIDSVQLCSIVNSTSSPALSSSITPSSSTFASSSTSSTSSYAYSSTPSVFPSNISSASPSLSPSPSATPSSTPTSTPTPTPTLSPTSVALTSLSPTTTTTTTTSTTLSTSTVSALTSPPPSTPSPSSSTSTSVIPCTPLPPSSYAASTGNPLLSFSLSSSPSSPPLPPAASTWLTTVNTMTLSFQHSSAAWGGNFIGNTKMQLIPAYPDMYACSPLSVPPSAGNMSLSQYYGGRMVMVYSGLCTHAFKGQNVALNNSNAAAVFLWSSSGHKFSTNNSYYPPNGSPVFIPIINPDSNKFGDFLFSGVLSPSFGSRILVSTLGATGTCDGDWQALKAIMSSATQLLQSTRLYIRPWTDLVDPVNMKLDPCLQRIQGLTCIGSRIVQISGSGLSLSSNPISSALTNLTALTVLMLQSNSFAGALPDLSNMNQLLYIDVSFNMFSSVQSDFSTLPLVYYIDISSNRISSLPLYLPLSISHFAASTNTFSSTACMLPSSYSNLTMLKYLDLSISNVCGPLSVLSYSGSLQTLTIHDSAVTALPVNTSALVTVSAANTLISTIPSCFSTYRSLATLDVSASRLVSISNLVFSGSPLALSLQILLLNTNAINDTALPNFSGMMSLVQVDMHANAITGTISPSMFDSCPNLKLVNFAQNQLHGSLPNFVGASSIQSIDFSLNNLVGFIPFWTYSPVQILRLSHNCLSGSTWPGDQVGAANTHKFGTLTCPSLTLLDISYNCNITIPPNFGDLSQWLQSMPATLVTFIASNNLLSGTFSNPGASPSNLPALTSLIVGNNLLTSFNPSAILPLYPLIQKLDLSNNLISGSSVVPTADPNYNLGVLLLSGNSNITLPSSSLPSYLAFSTTLYEKTNVTDTFSCPIIVDTQHNMQLTLDPRSYGYRNCVCDRGYYQQPPSCTQIPNIVDDRILSVNALSSMQMSSQSTANTPINVNGGAVITDAIYGNQRLTLGMDTTFLIGVSNTNSTSSSSSSSSSVLYLSVVLTLNTSSFNQLFDVVAIYEGDATLQGVRVMSVSGASATQQQYEIQIFNSTAAVNFRSRQTSGSLFSLTWSAHSDCPATYTNVPTLGCISLVPVSLSAQLLIYVLVSFTLSLLLISACILVVYRESVVVRASSAPFALLTLLGIAGVACAGLTFAAQPKTEDDTLCHVRGWILPISILCVLATLIVRTNRIYEIFENNKLSVRKSISNSHLSITILCMLSLEFIACIIYSSARLSQSVVVVTDPVTKQGVVQCTSVESTNYLVWLCLQCVYISILMAYSVYLAFQVKETPEAFNEAASIFHALVGLCGFSLLLLPIQFIVDSNATALVLLRGLGCALCALVLCGALYAPKFHLIAIGRANDKSLMTAKKSSSTPGPVRIANNNNNNNVTNVGENHDNQTVKGQAPGESASNVNYNTNPISSNKNRVSSKSTSTSSSNNNSVKGRLRPSATTPRAASGVQLTLMPTSPSSSSSSASSLAAAAAAATTSSSTTTTTSTTMTNTMTNAAAATTLESSSLLRADVTTKPLSATGSHEIALIIADTDNDAVEVALVSPSSSSSSSSSAPLALKSPSSSSSSMTSSSSSSSSSSSHVHHKHDGGLTDTMNKGNMGTVNDVTDVDEIVDRVKTLRNKLEKAKRSANSSLTEPDLLSLVHTLDEIDELVIRNNNGPGYD